MIRSGVLGVRLFLNSCVGKAACGRSPIATVQGLEVGVDWLGRLLDAVFLW